VSCRFSLQSVGDRDSFSATSSQSTDQTQRDMTPTESDVHTPSSCVVKQLIATLLCPDFSQVRPVAMNLP
jgi:hypothetical protein